MIKQRKITWLSILIGLLLAAFLLAACGANIPADTESTDAESTDSVSQDEAIAEADTESNISDVFGETAVSANNSSSSANNNSDALPADTEIDVNGVPIGFTENGNPYRGNPNAPVVMEEFSDFQ